MKTILSVFFLGLLMFPVLAGAEAIQVQKAEDFLKNLGTAKADFIQRSSMGGRLTATFNLDRPGKLRFEYNEVDDFIVADGLFIYFYDSELGEQSNAPIGQTLADFLLRDDLTLNDELKVKNSFRQNGYTYITLVQADEENAGSVDLIFSEVPFMLRKWRINDATGETTEIELKNFERDVDLDSKLFVYLDPKGRKPLNE